MNEPTPTFYPLRRQLSFQLVVGLLMSPIGASEARNAAKTMQMKICIPHGNNNNSNNNNNVALLYWQQLLFFLCLWLSQFAYCVYAALLRLSIRLPACNRKLATYYLCNQFLVLLAAAAAALALYSLVCHAAFLKLFKESSFSISDMWHKLCGGFCLYIRQMLWKIWNVIYSILGSIN